MIPVTAANNAGATPKQKKSKTDNPDAPASGKRTSSAKKKTSTVASTPVPFVLPDANNNGGNVPFQAADLTIVLEGTPL